MSAIRELLYESRHSLGALILGTALAIFWSIIGSITHANQTDLLLGCTLFVACRAYLKVEWP